MVIVSLSDTIIDNQQASELFMMIQSFNDYSQNEKYNSSELEMVELLSHYMIWSKDIV